MKMMNNTLRGRVIIPLPTSKKQFNREAARGMRTAFLELDTKYDLVDYYRSLTEKRFNLELCRPMRNPHVTILDTNQISDDRWNWWCGKYVGKQFQITLLPAVINSNMLLSMPTHSPRFWWMRVHALELMNLRGAAGINPKPKMGFHLTYALAKPNELVPNQWAMNYLTQEVE